MVACIIEWRHSQNLDKWLDHPPAEHEYIIKVNEFLMYAGLETLFLGLKDRDSHAILLFTLHPNLTTARERRRFVPFPVKQETPRNRKALQEAN